jgi:TrmH family RNA methyltransferase
MRISDVAIVLVRPQRAVNVAAASRALKNMGLTRLRLVAPPADLLLRENRGAAYGAWDVLDGAETFGDLGSAVADATFVVGTSGKSGAAALSPRELAAAAAGRGGRLAVVFGPEASGLSTDELRLCHATVRIPTSLEHSSLNLAQAVLVVAYELFLGTAGAGRRDEPAAPATAGELETALGELREALLAIGFLNVQNPEKLLAEGRALLARSEPTAREVTLLRGLARQLAWAAARAGATKGQDA